MTDQQKLSRNPLFLVLAVLSVFPALFFFALASAGAEVIGGIGFLWSAMWAWVWWSMSDRYR